MTTPYAIRDACAARLGLDLGALFRCQLDGRQRLGGGEACEDARRRLWTAMRDDRTFGYQLPYHVIADATGASYGAVRCALTRVRVAKRARGRYYSVC